VTRQEVLRLIHILSAVVWVGGAITMRLVARWIPTADPAHRLGFARDQGHLIRAVFTPAALILATGIWMVVDSPMFGFGQIWILIGLVTVVGSMGIAHGYTLPRAARAIRLAEEGKGPEAGMVMQRLSPIINTVVALLALSVVAMIVKPGL
jgi:uncharacterized membrane protein